MWWAQRTLLITLLLLLSKPAAAVLYVGGTCQFATIQAAIDAAGPVEGILVSPGTYKEALEIDGKHLVIFGAYTGCGIAAGPTIVDATGKSGHSALFIHGVSDVDIGQMKFTGGSTPGKTGGGIAFTGSGRLVLENDTIMGNSSSFGGGVSVTPNGATTVEIEETVIVENTADTDGGGVNIDGPTRLKMLGPGTFIASNHAPNGRGGGINITGPARADIGSSGFGGLGVVYNNDAKNGGGIAAVARQADNQAAVVRLFTTDPDHPVKIQANSATHGGGIYLRPFNDAFNGDASAALCAYDFRIVENAANDGSAIYADSGPDGFGESSAFSWVFLNTSDNPAVSLSAADFRCNPEPASDLGGVACTPGIQCNDITDNFTIDGSTGAPTAGATILIQNSQEFVGNRFSVRRSRGGFALRAHGESGFADVHAHNCLFADNNLSHELISLESSGQSQFDACTFAHTILQPAHVIHAKTSLVIENSIFYEEKLPLDFSDTLSNLRLAYLVSLNSATLPATALIVADPQFVDPDNGDYHLSPTSPALDAAPAANDTGDAIGNDVDLDGHPRAVDLPGIPSVDPMHLTRDIGAYELQRVGPCSESDKIFCDGFGG